MNFAVLDVCLRKPNRNVSSGGNVASEVIDFAIDNFGIRINGFFGTAVALVISEFDVVVRCRRMPTRCGDDTISAAVCFSFNQ